MANGIGCSLEGRRTCDGTRLLWWIATEEEGPLTVTDGRPKVNCFCWMFLFFLALRHFTTILSINIHKSISEVPGFSSKWWWKNPSTMRGEEQLVVVVQRNPPVPYRSYLYHNTTHFSTILESMCVSTIVVVKTRRNRILGQWRGWMVPLPLEGYCTIPTTFT